MRARDPARAARARAARASRVAAAGAIGFYPMLRDTVDRYDTIAARRVHRTSVECGIRYILILI